MGRGNIVKVVVAIDSFKGSMTSMEAGTAAKEGVLRVCDAKVVVKPLADGGEGTVDALVEGLGGRYHEVTVSGPLGLPVTARYGILKDGRTAVMEMAEAAGITLVKQEERDPWRASTTGVGEMILHALEEGCREFIVGIGGSATTEGGIGMLEALGYEFYDGEGKRLPPVLESLGQIHRISDAQVPVELKECHFQIACDVKNPLCGENGAAAVFGPQKGVKPEEISGIDERMEYYARQTALYTGKECSRIPGAGASGGLGFAFLSYFPNADLKPGAEIVLAAIDLERELENTDVVITGEGCLDAQTVMGKVPIGVAHLAKKYGCHVLAFAGGVTEDAGKCNKAGIDAFFPIVRGAMTLAEAMEPETAKKNMALSVEQVFRILNLSAT